MPTFQKNIKIGTKVALIKTDDIADGAITKTKLSQGLLEEIKSDVGDGTKVPMIRTDNIADRAVTTDKIADGAVTKDKLSNSILDYIKSNTGEGLKDKFLHISGGTMTGPIVYEESSTRSSYGSTALFRHEEDKTIIQTEASIEGVKITYIQVDSQNRLEARYKHDSISILKNKNGASRTIFRANDDGVTSEGFITNDQSIQGLLANDGTVAEVVSHGDIDEMFN